MCFRTLFILICFNISIQRNKDADNWNDNISYDAIY
nr:MAG TPA: hypothetical protein [Caudoviricetes sp.]